MSLIWILAIVLFLVCVLASLWLLRAWCHGPSAGSTIKKRLDGKVVVITGGNGGIGKEVVRDLATRGARVLMLCRDLTKANGVVEEFQQLGWTIEVGKIDLASLASVRTCALDILQSEPVIDVLINNAGVMMTSSTKTEDGFDLQLMANHLGHFLLTEMLMPLLHKSAQMGHQPRIIILSSVAHAWGSIHWEDLNWERTRYNSLQAYAQSKLANVLHAQKLARALDGSDVTVFCVHPGIVDTNLIKHLEMSFFMRCISPLARWIIKSPAQGAETTLFCVLEDSILDRSGSYFVDCREQRPHSRALMEDDQDRLWIESMRLIESA